MAEKSSKVNHGKTFATDHVQWNFRTQNSRSKNVFSKSFNPKSSWILINPESFPRCRLQRNNKKGTKGNISAPSDFGRTKIQIFSRQNFERTEIFSARKTLAGGYRTFISKFFWTRTLSIFKLLRDVPCGWLLRNWRYRSNFWKPKEVTPKMQP